MKTNPTFHLLSFVLFLNVSMQNLSANTYVVNNTGDYSPLPSALQVPIAGTLRWAVDQATMNAGPDTITFDLSYPATITLSSGFPVFLTTDLVIEGPGKDNLTISGNNTTRHFWVQNGNIFISGLTLSNGRAKGGNGSGGGMGAGGSIFMHEGSKSTAGNLQLSVSDVIFENNHAIGGNVDGFSGGGGLGGNGSSGVGAGGGGIFGNGGLPYYPEGTPQPYISYGGGGGSLENGQNGQDGASGMGGIGNDLFGEGGDGALHNWSTGPNLLTAGNGGYGGGGGGYPNRNGNYDGGDGGFGGGGGTSLSGGDGGFGGGGGYGSSGGPGGAGGFGGGNGWGANSGSPGFGGGDGAGVQTVAGSGGGGMGAGGAIFVTTGTLNLTKVAFKNNTATGGIGGDNSQSQDEGKGHGGAIFVFDHTRFTTEVTNQLTPWGFTNPSSVIACLVDFENNTASTPTESDNDVFGPISENPLSCFEITGRDTSICPGEMVDLGDFIEGLYTSISYGTTFGSYPNELGKVMPVSTTTYYVADSMDGMLIDTAKITITVSTTLECFMDISSDNQIKFGDPCICDQVVNSGGDFYFRDTLIIETDAGQEIRYSTLNASNFYSMPGVPMPDGALFGETEPGVYKLEFYKLSNAQAMGSITLNGGEPFAIPEEDLELCYVNVDCPALIPTMGQWGLIILSLLLSIIGIGFIRIFQRSFAGKV